MDPQSPDEDSKTPNKRHRTLVKLARFGQQNTCASRVTRAGVGSVYMHGATIACIRTGNTFVFESAGFGLCILKCNGSARDCGRVNIVYLLGILIHLFFRLCIRTSRHGLGMS
ncbi:uncharacterized protein MONBRDRAFT_4958 [Monosiga brevicollis MX1]|uniref:Uncharacterized protein n=1 Tax=Monosiga brevicollis TaxID=81824 RepID=A9UPG7_MONBE|nr:uncharacterized protein MONBRDRAFT_4958 [Monosiga brevicollis MX1]EDQ92419.1 predicted protein [Monosiga brevicollis MX1]|eukprot:XP_001742181.1 hypothetical protein [Monosiga brevicollis MX1]